MTQIVIDLLEVSLNQLDSNTSSSFPNSSGRHNAVDEVRVVKKSFLKIDVDKLKAIATVQGSEGQSYQCTCIFNKVNFVDQTAPDAVSVGDSYVQKISNLSDTQVKCTCKDFYWTFAWFNSANSALDGKPPKPYRATGLRPPRNQPKVPGICKHLMKLRNELIADGIIG
jgi:hypothetical protein